MRSVLVLQGLFFLLFGATSGLAFSRYLDAEVAHARTQAISAILLRLPVSQLSEVDV